MSNALELFLRIVNHVLTFDDDHFDVDYSYKKKNFDPIRRLD